MFRSSRLNPERATPSHNAFTKCRAAAVWRRLKHLSALMNERPVSGSCRNGLRVWLWVSLASGLADG
jgi:hypothetical protein